MNLSQKFPLPEFVLLDGENHLGEQLLERTVILHIPTQTLLEVIAVDPNQLAPYKDLQHFPFVFNNIDGEDEHHLLLVHSSNAGDTVMNVMMDAAKWYGNYANWIDGAIDNML